MFKKTSFAVSTDMTTRINLTGIYWEIKEDNMIVVATDGHRLAKASIPFKHAPIPGVIASVKALSLALKLAQPDEDLKIGINNTTLKISSPWATLYTKQIEGNYPDYQTVIPKQFNLPIEVSREELISVLKRVSTIASNVTRQVKLTFNNNKIELSAQNQDIGGDSEESISINYSQESINIAFNAYYLIEVLKLIDSENINIKLTPQQGATLIAPTDSEAYFFIVMPLRLM